MEATEDIKEEPDERCDLIIKDVYEGFIILEEISQHSAEEVEEIPADIDDSEIKEVNFDKPKTRKRKIRQVDSNKTIAIPRLVFPQNPELEEEIRNLPNTKNGKVNCSKCDQLVLKRYYRQHMQRVHMKRLECDLCDKRFFTRPTIAEHMNDHLNIKPISCTHDCGRMFANSTAMRAHVNLKHKGRDENIFVCEICASSFNDKTRFNVSF